MLFKAKGLKYMKQEFFVFKFSTDFYCLPLLAYIIQRVANQKNMLNTNILILVKFSQLQNASLFAPAPPSPHSAISTRYDKGYITGTRVTTWSFYLSVGVRFSARHAYPNLRIASASCVCGGNVLL